MYSFRIGCGLLAVLLLAGFGSAPEAQAEAVEARPLVEEISFTPRADGRGYVVRIHTSGRISAYGEPQREGDVIEWTLFNVNVGRDYHEAEARGPVERYSAQPDEGHLILRFHLRPGAQVEAAAYRDGASDDLLLGLTVRTDALPALPALPVAAAPDQPARSTGTASDAGTSYSSGARWQLDTVVLDAGHGGKDPGAQAYGLDEKDINLAIVKKLGHYIEENMPSVDVVYTRTTDRFVELRERGRTANAAGGKLFISVHANAAHSRSAHGTETYFLGLHRTESARKVMERENSVIRYEDNPEQYEEMDDQALIMQTLAQSAYLRQSEHLAALVEDQFAHRVQRTSRGVKQAGFLVLWAASMPAVLVETGFMTNRAEARFLASEQGQTYIASGIFRAVRAFKADYEKGLHLSARE